MFSGCFKCCIVMLLQGLRKLEIAVVVIEEVFSLEDVVWPPEKWHLMCSNERKDGPLLHLSLFFLISLDSTS